jgi:hypothetical protein
VFIRQKKNKTGSLSVQIIYKVGGNYKIIKTIGSSEREEQVKILVQQVKFELISVARQSSFIHFIKNWEGYSIKINRQYQLYKQQN